MSTEQDGHSATNDQDDNEQAIQADVERVRQETVEQAIPDKDQETIEGVNQAIQVDVEKERLEDAELQETASSPEVQQVADSLPPSTDESSMHMEALRMETPTPPLPATYEKPSTSKAAREALELSLIRQQNKGNKPKKKLRIMLKRNIVEDNAFKQPLPCASYSAKKKSILKNELTRLQINLRDETLPSDENELSNDQNSSKRLDCDNKSFGD